MMTITVPNELVLPLTEEARRRGTTPESLALEGVRLMVVTNAPRPVNEGSLLDFLAGHVGTVAGSAEPFSQDCGREFADGLASGRPARP